MGQQWITHDDRGGEVVMRAARAHVQKITALRDASGTILAHRVYLRLVPDEWEGIGPHRVTIISPLVSLNRPEVIKEAEAAIKSGGEIVFTGVWSRLPEIDPGIPASELKASQVASHILRLESAYGQGAA